MSEQQGNNKVGWLKRTPLTHHPVLSQDFNEVKRVKAQEQNKLVLTFTVIACSLGEEMRNDQLPLCPAEQESLLRTELNSSGAKQQLRPRLGTRFRLQIKIPSSLTPLLPQQVTMPRAHKHQHQN